MASRLNANFLMLAVALLFHLAMADTWYKQFKFWSQSATYQHAFLVLPVFVYLIWQRRDVPRGDASAWGVAALLTLSGVWIGAQLVNIEFVEFSASLLFFSVLVWAYKGNRGAQALWFPMSYIAFALPWWGVLAVPLQMGTAYAAAEVLRWVDIPIFVDKQWIHIPSGAFEIEQACAGLHFLIVALALASLLAYLEPFSSRARAKILVSAALLGLAVNWLRVVIVIVIGHSSDMTHPWVHDHRSFGWAIFMVSLVPWFWWVWRWREESREIPRPLPTALARRRYSHALSFGIAGLLVLGAGKTALVWSAERELYAADPGVSANRWGASNPLSRQQWNPIYRGATFSLLREYRFENRPLWYFRAEYEAQTRGVEMVSSTNDIAGEGWVYLEVETPTLGNGMPVNMARLRSIAEGGTRRVILYWYDVNGRVANTAWQEKSLELMSWLQGHRPRVAVHALTSPALENDDAEAQAWLTRAVSAAFAEYDEEKKGRLGAL